MVDHNGWFHVSGTFPGGSGSSGPGLALQPWVIWIVEAGQSACRWLVDRPLSGRDSLATMATNNSGNEPGPLSWGRDNMAIPGPSNIPDRVLRAMSHPMTDIYEGSLVDVSDRILEELPVLAGTEGKAFIIIGNGHAAWQMAIDNTMSAGDKVLVCESGPFAVIWGYMAEKSGVDVEVLPGSTREPVDVDALQSRLAADTDHEIKAVLCVQTDTASSVRNDIPAMRRAIDAAGHPAMFMVDCIASLGCERFEMDAWGVDLTVGASQKGLMVPPGLGFVWAGDRALAAYETAGLRSGYTEWADRMNPSAHYEIYAGTPPVSHLFAMVEALDMISEEGGLPAIWTRHEMLASAVWAAVDAWAAPDAIEFNITDAASRSTAVTTILTGSVDAGRLRRTARYQAGLTLGRGLGDFVDRAFRIGHMGHGDAPSILGTLATVEACLLAMGAPLGGSGIEAATTAIGGYLR